MPCFSVTTITFDVQNWKNERMLKALHSSEFTVGQIGNRLQIDGMGISARITNGRLEISGRNEMIIEAAKKKLYQYYSAQTVKDASIRFGFKIQNQSKTPNGLMQITIGR
jgi:hypothetical protein